MMTPPKRKRTAPSVPQIDTLAHTGTCEADPDSPRSKVAANLLQLRIQDTTHPQPIPPAQAQSHISKKRHLQHGTSDDLYETTEQTKESIKAMVTPPKDFSPVDAMDEVFEIGETPGAYASFSSSSRYPSSPPMSPSPSPNASPSPLKLDSEGVADSEEEEEIEVTTNSRRGRVSFRPCGNSPEYRSISHTSAGRQARSDAAGGGFELVVEERVPEKVQQRRKKVSCGATPITTPPPPTPVTSPGEGGLQQPIMATAAAARMMSIPTLPLPDIPSLCSPVGKKRKSPPLAPTSEPFQNAAPAAARAETPTADQHESMTWTDKEITGHLWNPDLDIDDDGEGINGIGFRPTAAIEWKRREGRKRQISDWRAREAKEERRRRLERRKRGSGGGSASTWDHGGGGGGGGRLGKLNLGEESSGEGDAADGEHEGKRARVRFAPT